MAYYSLFPVFLTTSSSGCDTRVLPPNGLFTPGAPHEHADWVDVERNNCQCPPGLNVTAIIEGEIIAIPAKICQLPMRRQGLSVMTIYSAVLDVPAYTGLEVDRGDYGVLSSMLGHADRRRTWIDIGANLGIFTIALALANKDAHGVAVEPNPVTYTFLKHNLMANGLLGRVRPIHGGLSLDSRTLRMPRCVVFSQQASQMATTQWTLEDRMRNKCFSGACHSKYNVVSNCMKKDPFMLSMPSQTISHLMHNSHLSLLKIDCEGCEYEVLDEIEQMKRNASIAQVVGECHPLHGLRMEDKKRCLSIVRGQSCSSVTDWMGCLNSAGRL